MKTKKDKIVDLIFLIVLAAAIVVLIFNIRAGWRDDPETVSEATTAPTTEETATVETECTEIEATEETLPVTLYDVPLDVSLQEHIIEQAETHGIDPAIVVAMCWKETQYNPKAIGDGGNSYGLLQVQPRWHYERMLKLGCTNLLDPYQNVTVAVDYLAENLNRYGSIEAAVTAYNAGSYTGTVTQYAKTVVTMADELAVMK